MQSRFHPDHGLHAENLTSFEPGGVTLFRIVCHFCAPWIHAQRFFARGEKSEKHRRPDAYGAPGLLMQRCVLPSAMLRRLVDAAREDAAGCDLGQLRIRRAFLVERFI